MIFRTSILAIASLTLLAISACAPAQPSSVTSPSSGAGGASAPKKIVGSIGSGDPQILRSNAGGVFGGSAAGIDSVEALVHAGTADWDNNGVLHAVLARDVPTLENGHWKLLSDGRMQTSYDIVPTATWHDGVPFTSEDLAFTLQISKDREMLAFTSNVGFDSIDSWETPAPQTFLVNWKTAFSEADTLFTKEFANPIPAHLVD